MILLAADCPNESRQDESKPFRPLKADVRPRPALKPQGRQNGAGIIRTGSIASLVLLDPARGIAIKRYRPGPLVRALYWFCFQAGFPYMSNVDALEAARERRLIAGLLLKAELGREVVAPIMAVRFERGRGELISQFIAGGYPRDGRHARLFLDQASEILGEAGLNLWQVWRWNPKAVSNLVETASGEYRIIDLESSLVTPPVPNAHFWSNLAAGAFPVFDDINFGFLREYVAQRAGLLHETLGEDGFAELNASMKRCHEHMHAWKDREPRLWGRLVALLLKPFPIRQTACH